MSLVAQLPLSEVAAFLGWLTEEPQDLKSKSCATIHPVSRLRRLFVSGKIFFITCNVLRARTSFTREEFQILARVLDHVRERRGFLLSGYVFMPDHWHALIYPAPADTLPRLMGALKIASSRAINRARHTQSEFWQLRYFDRAIRTVREYREALQYMHFNAVRKGLVKKPEDWPWASFHSYGGPGPIRLRVDLLDLPADGNFRLYRKSRPADLRPCKAVQRNGKAARFEERILRYQLLQCGEKFGEAFFGVAE